MDCRQFETMDCRQFETERPPAIELPDDDVKALGARIDHEAI